MKKNSQSPRVGIRVARITALMAAIYAFFHWMPAFAPERPETFLRKTATDASPELCSDSSLGFTRVTERRSPLVMRLHTSADPRVDEEVRVIVALERVGGKPLTLDDLEETHTQKFHLLIIDPTLEDYHHEHLVSTGAPGEYEFRFTPRKSGSYRFFADLVPVATGRPVQAVASLNVPGEGGEPSEEPSLESTVAGYRFGLVPPADGVRAGKPGILSFDIRSLAAGERVSLEPVMGAFAHLVAFDRDRSGFAHMHPVEEGLDVELDETEPRLDFVFYAENPGAYTVWAQVKIGGEERFAPFVVEVL